MKIIESRIVKFSAVFSIGLLMSACQNNDTTELEPKPLDPRRNLGQLTSDIEQPSVNIVSLGREERARKLADLYKSILTLEPDQNVRAQILHRQIQLDVREYEKQDIETRDDILAKLVADYQNVLKTQPNRRDNEKIRYDLAKTLDLQGKMKESLEQTEILLAQYPDTKFFVELQFRRAEIYYSLQNYPKALRAYEAVLAANYNDKYRLNSLYMSGWSLFKLNRLEQADIKFLQVLSAIVDEDRDQIATNYFDFNKISGAQKSLVDDTLRILSISLSQQEQGESLLALTEKFSSDRNLPFFEHFLFDNLAGFLLEKKLNHDAIKTYQTYIAHAPEKIWAARYSLTLRDLLEKFGRFKESRELQTTYVTNFGIGTDFWQFSLPDNRDEVAPHLLSFSFKQSRRLYAAAQDIEDNVQRQLAFAETAKWLGNYLDVANYAYPKKVLDGEYSEQEFLFADANFEANNLESALEAYQILAYGYNPRLREIYRPEFVLTNRPKLIALDSAYATTVTVRELIKQATRRDPDMNHADLYEHRELLDRRFIEQYPQDVRSTLIALQSSQYAYEKGDYEMVFYFSDFVLNYYQLSGALPEGKALSDWDDLQLKQIQTATQLQANSHYEQWDYEEAEREYLVALSYLTKPLEQKKLKELVASSIYQQAEISKTNDLDTAIEHLMRLGQVIPDSNYRVTAEYDAANLLLQSKQFPRAITVLKNFQQRYPNHEFTDTIPAKLAMSYEALEQWDLAAEQLLTMVASQTSPELKREAQYTAAEYYLRAGDTNKAIDNFRTYAHAYPEPFSQAQEARYQLSELYAQTDEPLKRHFWFRKIVKSHDTSASKRAFITTEVEQRSTYLASFSAYQLGVAHQQTFNWVKLKVPLNKSLVRKQKAMKEAIDYYQRVFIYQLAEFVPQANFNLAQMYNQLAQDVMSSQRPSDLNDLALEEYDILLEEIAYPFEEKSIGIHISNIKRAWQNVYSDSIKQSFNALQTLEPAKYDRVERQLEVVDVIF